MICCNSKHVDSTMLSNHFLANQIAGKPVRISCPIIMFWIELTVQFCGAALAGLNGPVDGALGAMSVLPGSKPTTGKTRTLSTLRCGSFCPKT